MSCPHRTYPSGPLTIPPSDSFPFKLGYRMLEMSQQPVGSPYFAVARGNGCMSRSAVILDELGTNVQSVSGGSTNEIDNLRSLGPGCLPVRNSHPSRPTHLGETPIAYKLS